MTSLQSHRCTRQTKPPGSYFIFSLVPVATQLLVVFSQQSTILGLNTALLVRPGRYRTPESRLYINCTNYKYGCHGLNLSSLTLYMLLINASPFALWGEKYIYLSVQHIRVMPIRPDDVNFKTQSFTLSITFTLHKKRSKLTLNSVIFAVLFMCRKSCEASRQHCMHPKCT